MQSHERVGVDPVTGRRVAAIDDGDMDIGVVDQRVGKRDTHRATTDHEVVGGQCARRHRISLASATQPVDSSVSADGTIEP